MDSKIESGMYARGAAALLLTASLALAGCSANGGGGSSGSSGASSSSGSSGSSGSGIGPNILLQASSSSGSFSVGTPFTLTWTSSDPTAQCAGNGGSPGDGWGGTEPADGSATVTESTSGTFTYVLTCVDATGSGVGTASVAVGAAGSSSSSGSSGTSSSSGASSSSSSGSGVAAPTVTISLSPNPVAPSTGTTVSTTTVTWSSTNDTACTASGGDGSDGWGGSEPASGMLSFPVPTVTGSYTYALSCTGPGGGGSGSTTLLVTNNTPPTTSISASPSSVAPGGSTTISWSTTGAASCTATGGDGSDGWSGAEPTSGSLTIVEPTTPGVYAYTLTCTNANGSTSNTSFVTVGTPPAPTVTITAAPASIQPGQSATLTWSSTNATACTASGSWSGSEPFSGTASTGTLSTAGAYSFELTCSGPSGSAAGVALLLVSGLPVTDDCGVGTPSVALVSPAYTATGSGTGLCTLLSALDLPLCSTSNLANVTDGQNDSFGTIDVTVGALTLATESVTVAPTSEPATPGPVIPGGLTVGFVVANPIDPVTVNLSQGLTISTLLNGSVVETSGGSSATQLNVLSLINTGNTNAAFLSFTTTPGSNFDTLELTDTADVATVLGTVNVYSSCVIP